MIYLAPIQGFTDFVYRKAYSEVFTGVDTFFIPYISLKNNQILKKFEKEILFENNPQKNVVPQVLVKDGPEMLDLSNILKNFGYNEINLNLGCPYPMVTNRGKGSGLLPHPNKIKSILNGFFEKSDQKLSLKVRSGLIQPNEIELLVPIFNEFPLSEIIFHPRIATQLYRGEVLLSAFKKVSELSKHRLVFNGDIFNLSDFKNMQGLFPNINNWMLGRGILMDPFLPSEINGIHFSEEEKRAKKMDFHQMIFDTYSDKMDNQGNTLNKMKQFWSYFSFGFPNQHKVFKKIKKAGSVEKYLNVVQTIFRD
ncbi:MAG: tRNA-dihydrouridine synthase family protein [Prolixibacteraceae bacterium]|jgi:tRNA-dihydrouridine synthase B|nr:tRNA-dihydrouridine synthase family protein [Prolixibacteraceae bacterium]MBT6007058.1 tRNA-dihydrouridine synthase family protein [Prolixibacteraceae bacterium]MBT6763378.1 tRNA-dihydrouridine synthase family protein [Prolixibacteraceae bacterium]MBT6999683.1 tRNA-dihydrouridine synthase family protein [Prolixibacteraceae bacterium]MBT7395037.1 tRNA-dihydrouridine synthase family protein [Prolixibacteraceae bacterium]